ncbi:MAG: hypothetical protein V4555_19620 [Acidobacteriota bacterium]
MPIPPPPPQTLIWPHGAPAAGQPQKADFGTHTLSISHHDSHGEAEVHAAGATLMICQSGEADLLYGGNLVNPRRLSPTELRGTTLSNATRIHVSPGDVIHFAPAAPHQWIVAPGQTATFLVVHIIESRPK